jgi:uncharacterized protein
MAYEGQFIWHELMTRDMAAAAQFYGAVVGWTHDVADNMTAAGERYMLFKIPGQEMGVCGMMALTSQMIDGGARPGWIGYVAVDDVDAKATAFTRYGGTVHMPPTDIPGIGRFAVVADPHGAILNLFKPQMPEGPLPDMPKPGTPGTVGWNELYAGDGAEAFDFYSRLFGWQKSNAVDMGPMGVYQVFALEGRDIGGMMTKMETMPIPFWNYYFTVEALDPAIAILKAQGGTVINGPHEVPGGAWIVQALDPQGAMFSLTAARR